MLIQLDLFCRIIEKHPLILILQISNRSTNYFL